MERITEPKLKPCICNLFNMKALSECILNSRYLSRWIVLLMDTVASVASTTVAVYLIDVVSISWTLSVGEYVLVAAASAIASVASFMAFGTYRKIMRHSSLQEMWRITMSVLTKTVVLIIAGSIYNHVKGHPISKMLIFLLLDFVVTSFILIMIRVVLIVIYRYFVRKSKGSAKRMYVYGVSESSIYTLESIVMNPDSEYKMLGYVIKSDVDSKMRMKGFMVHSVATKEAFDELMISTRADGLIFADYEEAVSVKHDVIDFCTHKGYKVMIIPRMNEVAEGDSLTSFIREVKVEDLLGRDVIKINLDEISKSLKDKVVMVTGGAGSIGSELCRLVSTFGIRKLLVVDQAETPLHNIQLDLQDRKLDVEYDFILADVRDKCRMEAIFKENKPSVVFHAAAYKHVPMVENNPCEGVNTNVFGTKVVADLALKYGADRFVMVSTDKAVNPTNVMGATKRIAEIYVQSLGLAVEAGKVPGKTKFVTTRFGNVLGSNGSVIPRFRAQIMNGGPVTVTHKDIIRYFMTIPEACRLVLEAAYLGNGNKIYVFDMGKPVKIYDLARNMIIQAGLKPDVDIKIEVTGLRPGEKLYEELLNNKENTIPTDHEKISIAQVREYDYEEVLKQFEILKQYSFPMLKWETVRQMKVIVPEFVSNNSVYCELDKERGNVK